MKTAMLFSYFLLSIPVCFSQHVAWTKSPEHSGFNQCMASDDAGNFYVAGAFSDSARFGNILLQSGIGQSPDAYVAKMDWNGNWIWAVKIYGNENQYVNDIAYDRNGGLYICGNY